MTRTRKDADRDVLHIKKGGKVNLEFCWDNFKKEKYTDIKDKLDKRAKLADDYIGSVRVGEICVDVLIRDYGEGDTPKYAYSYDFYVANEDTGWKAIFRMIMRMAQT